MLYYFASQDAMVSHTIARRFFWSEYILWKEDVENLPLTVTLSGQDIIVPAHPVWQYLTNGSSARPVPCSFDNETSHLLREDTAEWENGLLKVVWFEEFNHAGLFKSKRAQRGIAEIARGYSKLYGHSRGFGQENGNA